MYKKVKDLFTRGGYELEEAVTKQYKLKMDRIQFDLVVDELNLNKEDQKVINEFITKLK